MSDLAQSHTTMWTVTWRGIKGRKSYRDEAPARSAAIRAAALGYVVELRKDVFGSFPNLHVEILQTTQPGVILSTQTPPQARPSAGNSAYQPKQLP